MKKRIFEPNTTLFPVPVVLITTGGDTPNVMMLNRIDSCSAEPPRITTNLHLAPAMKVKTPLLAECPVNIECAVEHTIELDSHTLFIGLVQAVHVDESLLNGRGEVDLTRAHGLVYQAGVVRERPTYNFHIAELRQAVR